VCNSDKQLDAHHRTYERIFNEEPGDLTVLCRKCHDRHHDADKLKMTRRQRQAERINPFTQGRILGYLADHPGADAHTIGIALEMDRQMVNKLLGAMNQKSIAKRSGGWYPKVNYERKAA
jgi:hypothetical protein